MRMFIFLVTLALGCDLSAAVKTNFALFNGLPVGSREAANSGNGYGRVLAALERGKPQHLIVEYQANRKRDNRGQELANYNQTKKSTLQSFDPAEIKELLDYSHLPMSVVRVNSSRSLDQLMRHSQVKAVYEDTLNQLFLNQSLPLIQQPAVEIQGYTGKNTAVSILDTGVDYTHPAFGSCSWPGFPSGCKVAYAQDFAPDDGSLDSNGHGTNVAGISLGVAPDTSILALDVFDGNSAWDSDVIDAINWSISNQATYNIAAINMSLGSGRYFSECGSSVYSTPITVAKTAGILVAVASGNDAYKDSIASPACVPDAVSVGAVYDSNIGGLNWSSCSDPNTAADQVTCFSNSASFLDLLAPGALITAAGLTQGGTSQAAPHVAGAAATLAQKYPTESVDQWSSRLKNTGVGQIDDANGIIKARIDVYDAVSDASAPCIGDMIDVDNAIYYSGDIKDCIATSRIKFGPDITANSGAAITLTAPIVTTKGLVRISHGATFSINNPEGEVPITTTRILNDTGIVYCSNNTTNDLACPLPSYPGQDAEFGRDVTYNDDSDGHAGFSFTKLDANGAPLLASATSWSCVRDNVTGLTWEVKTDDGGLQDRDNGYTWYNPDSSNNGGDPGVQDGGSCIGSDCDTEGYVQAVNAQGLCGAKDWRMPTKKELQNILSRDRYNPAIDTDYYPNTVSLLYWSASPTASHSVYAWCINFYNGVWHGFGKRDYYYVRLVRDGQ